MLEALRNKIKRLNALVWDCIRDLKTIAVLERDRHVQMLLSDPMYADPKRLLRYGHKVYSQSDEDGIIAEIMNRVGSTNCIFVEFGVGDGFENNTLALIHKGWSGLWIDGSEDLVNSIKGTFREIIKTGRLTVLRSFITCENINELIGGVFQNEIDLLSIDIDGNEIHILKSLNIIRPRVLIVEYNAKFTPDISIAQTYNPTHVWRHTDYCGSSLSALTHIANTKGYTLVSCNITGVNAFFVRNDLVGDKFCAPFTAQNHYQPARYFLIPSYAGHPPDWGPYEIVEPPIVKRDAGV